MFFQQEEKTKWIPALASERESIAKNKKPALVSVLNTDNSFDSDMTVEEIRSVRYEGPFYVDFDAEKIEEATEQFKVFVTKLKAMGLNLDMVRFFASGKKGYHIEVPPQLFMGKVPSNGVLHLPDIYREMAHVLYVDSMDMRVYSSRRGRMWRCPNVKRADNGKYKVQLTAEEALGITPETYSELCSSPRNQLPIEPPAFNADFGLIYAQARDKVEKAVNKKKSRKPTAGQLKKFKGEWPETFFGILHGVTLKPDVGWNYISMQLAIVASELGKSEEQLLDDAKGVIESHKGDSNRYSTPAKRKDDLRQMFRYVNGNPCYEYSVGAVMALLMPEVRRNADIGFGEYEQDTEGGSRESTQPQQEGNATETEPVPIPEPLDAGGALRVNSRGIFANTEEGYRNVCDVGLQNPLIMAALDGDCIGYEIEVTLDGASRGKRFLPMNALSSRAQFNNWTLQIGASMRGTDQQVCGLVDLLRKGKTKVSYAVEREGIDVVRPNTGDASEEEDVIWVSPTGVVCTRDDISYRYHGIHNDGGYYRSDLMSAPDLCTEDGDFINDLFAINSPNNVGKILGWFCAAFLNQLIRKRFKRFPSLQIFGQAEAGKSATVGLMNHMHYHMVDPKQLQTSGMTSFTITSKVASSASIPVVFEEVKRRQMNKNLLDFMQSVLRSNYMGDELSRGSLTRDRTVRELTVTNYSNCAPIVFVGEALEDQTAILHRCVVVAMSKTDRQGRGAAFDRCLENHRHMGRIGKALALSALSIDRNWLANEVSNNFKLVTGEVAKSMYDEATRSSFNLGICLTGLEFLRKTLNRVFESRFDDAIENLKNAIMANIKESIPRNLAEASRVLDTMAQLTRNSDPTVRLEPNIDYIVYPNKGHLELKLRNAYDKYVKYQRSLGLEVLFDSHNAWHMAMVNYGGTVARAAPESPLFDSARALVFRLSLEYLDKEVVDSFEWRKSDMK